MLDVDARMDGRFLEMVSDEMSRYPGVFLRSSCESASLVTNAPIHASSKCFPWPVLIEVISQILPVWILIPGVIA